MYKAIMEQAEPLVAPPGCQDGDLSRSREFFHHCRQALITVGIIRDAVGCKCQNNHFLRKLPVISTTDNFFVRHSVLEVKMPLVHSEETLVYGIYTTLILCLLVVKYCSSSSWQFREVSYKAFRKDCRS
jgi:hypothetical protein